MSEYIPKGDVLKLWRYWKHIEAYDKTKEMEGIELDDYVPREWHDRVCEAMAKHHTADRPKGEWFKDDEGTFICSACGSGYKDQPTLMGKPMFEYCPLCGARMKGADDE